MKQFFHSWRQIAGCVTLVMACIVCCLWLRSFVVWDWITLYPTSDRVIEVKSERGRFSFERRGTLEWEFPNSAWSSETYQPSFSLFAFVDDQSVLDEIGEFDWRWDFAGFSTGQHSGYSLERPFIFVVVPFGAVAIPMTLLSAYLILWTPRNATSANQSRQADLSPKPETHRDSPRREV